MTNDEFALFIDVMGIQERLTTLGDTEGAKCRLDLRSFHDDLTNTIGIGAMMADMEPINGQPTFVAEFSDSAYLVGEFTAIAVAGITMMRKALRHQYPLRGGIGFGDFTHEESGVRATRSRQVWSTSSFLGGAVVRAFQAERCLVPGLRLFVHADVTARISKETRDTYMTTLEPNETNEVTSHELRLWRQSEAKPARERLKQLRDRQTLSPRAKQHYDSTLGAYERFSWIIEGLPGVTPALWLE